ncbi:MAG TPA: acyloxyacyl hydrolase [Verrucomicrobiae bacterium]|jgi:hypothetical protein
MFKKQIFAMVLIAAALPAAEVQSDATNAIPSWRNLDRWSFQSSVVLITGSTIDEIGTWDSELADGKAEGQIYLLQVSYKLAKEPVLFGHRFEMDLELPLVLGVVDEDNNDPFMQYSVGLTLRWKQFPWNKWVYTNFETGGGLTYSQHVLTTERERHPDRDRSHLEFYWPVQLMLAHPRHRDHQLVLLLHHHSGGGIFHRGGANSLGVGYRFVPGER